MTQAVAHLLDEVDRLSVTERAELADLLAERMTRDIPAEIEQVQLQEVRRRISEVEEGKVKLIPGAQAIEQARQSFSDAIREAE